MGNRKSLKEHLAGLKKFTPNEEVWDQLSRKIEHENELSLRLRQLPDFEPDERVWNQLETDLNKTGKLIWWKWSMAASIVLIGSFLVFRSVVSESEISISKEIISEFEVLPESDEEDKEYNKIIALCTQKVEVCRDPEFRELKEEFEELKNAGDQLREVMGAYNTKNQLLEELKKIETQKSELITQLTRYI